MDALQMAIGTLNQSIERLKTEMDVMLVDTEFDYERDTIVHSYTSDIEGLLDRRRELTKLLNARPANWEYGGTEESFLGDSGSCG